MNLDRRAFIGLAAGAAAGAALSSCASAASVPVVPAAGAVRLRLDDHPALLEPGSFVRLGLPDGAGQIYVTMLEAGEYAALSPICTHQGCTVGVAGARLVCPCHGSTYDRDGRVLRGPAESALRRFPAVVTADGELVITVDGTR